MAARGFTLVEMMVVLVILGLTATFATLGFQRLENDRLEKQAGQLGAWLQGMSDNAVLDGAVYGAWYDRAENRLRAGYFFRHRWLRLDGSGFASPALGDDTRLLLADADGDRPDILFLPVGMTSPERFELRERAGGRGASIERGDEGVFTWRIR